MYYLCPKLGVDLRVCPEYNWLKMESKRLKLPVGIQAFEELRSEGYVYVDKTKYLVKLIDTGKVYVILFFMRGCGVVVDAERQIKGGHNND